VQSPNAIAEVLLSACIWFAANQVFRCRCCRPITWCHGFCRMASAPHFRKVTSRLYLQM